MSENPKLFDGADGFDMSAINMGFKLPAISTEITLRDLFAAAALAGIMANGSLRIGEPHVYATDTYRLADAMLAARVKSR